MPVSKRKEILAFVRANPLSSSKEIHEGLSTPMGYATVKRILAELLNDGMLITEGSGRGTKYRTGLAYDLFCPIDMNDYFSKEIDEREITTDYNPLLIGEVLSHIQLFSEQEMQTLNQLQNTYRYKVSKLPASAYAKEMERLSIDLSWKSSQIEGNTYSLLETERLLKENQTAEGKSREEAGMLLNHKAAIDLILSKPSDLVPISREKMEKIHTVLVKGLGVELGIRTTGVGITGTNYRPPEYEQAILKALKEMSSLVNNSTHVFEKALLLLVLISYIQPFTDGNKRSARIISNAVLIQEGYCPLSYRTTDSMAFKKAMLLFYEQNNITAIKEIFMQQYEFAVNTYF